VEAERAFSAAGIFTTELRFSRHFVFPALVFISELSLNVTKPLGSPDCCTEYSYFVSGLIVLVNWGTFNCELIKFIKMTENTISA